MVRREHANDPEADGGRYVQNLVMVPKIEELCCAQYDECMANWEDITQFRSKAHDSYTHLDGLLDAWKSIIEDLVPLHEGNPPYGRWLNLWKRHYRPRGSV